MISKDILIESTMVDKRQKLKLPSLFGLFQDIAFADCEKIGYGNDVTTNAGKLWVFTRVQVEIKKEPSQLDHIEFLTYPNPQKGFAFPRQGLIKNSQGETLIQICSLSALIDSSSRRLLFKPGLPEAESNSLEGELPLPGKVVADEKVTYKFSRTIRASDIDLNGHMNNTRYIELLVDIHPTSFYEDHPIASLLINYESEVAEGETLDILTNEKATYVRGQCGDRVCFEANLNYR